LDFIDRVLNYSSNGQYDTERFLAEMYELIGDVHSELFSEVEDFAAPTSSTMTYRPVVDGTSNNATTQVTLPTFYDENTPALQYDTIVPQNEVSTPQYELSTLHGDIALPQYDFYGSQPANESRFSFHQNGIEPNIDISLRYSSLSAPAYQEEPSIPIADMYQPMIEIVQANPFAQNQRDYTSVDRTPMHSFNFDMTGYNTGYVPLVPSFHEPVSASTNFPSVGMFGVGVNPTSGECISSLTVHDNSNSPLNLDVFRTQSSQDAGLNTIVYQETVGSPTTYRDFIQYRDPVQFNSPNKVTKSPYKLVLVNLTDITPSKRSTDAYKRNDPNLIEASPSRKATSVVKRKQRVADLRQVAKTRKVSEIRKVSESQRQENTAQDRASPDLKLPYIHHLCGREFTTTQNVYDHHAGLAGGTSGCWVRNGKPQGVKW
jgi:hypothetical protein